MPVRNHVTQIMGGDVQAKQTPDGEQKATGEVKKADPGNADDVIAKNTKDRSNPNTVLDSLEKKVASGEVEDPEKKAQRKNDKKEEDEGNPTDSLTVAHPASSQAAGGKPVESKAKN